MTNKKMKDKIVFFIKIHLINLAPFVKKAVIIPDSDSEIKSANNIN